MPVWQAKAARKIGKRDCRTGRFAEPHVEIDERMQAHFLKQHAVAGFGGDVAGLRMRQRVGAQLGQRRHRGGANKTIEQNRNAPAPRRQCGAENGGKLAAAECRGYGQRVVQRCDMSRDRPVDRAALARQAVFVDAGAAAGPTRAAAAEQRRGDGRRRGGVADAHFAEADQIAVRRHRVVAGRHRSEEFLLAQRRLLGEVGGRRFERQRNDAQFRAGARAPAG